MNLNAFSATIVRHQLSILFKRLNFNPRSKCCKPARSINSSSLVPLALIYISHSSLHAPGSSLLWHSCVEFEHTTTSKPCSACFILNTHALHLTFVTSGVSETNAKAVMAHYSTALALWQAYRAAIQGAMAGGADGTAAARCLLQQRAGLQPGLSQKIYDTLFCNGAGM